MLCSGTTNRITCGNCNLANTPKFSRLDFGLAIFNQNIPINHKTEPEFLETCCGVDLYFTRAFWFQIKYQGIEQNTG